MARKRSPRKGVFKLETGRGRVLTLALAGLAGAAVAWVVWPFWQLTGQFERRTSLQPTRLYARPTRLARDEQVSPRGVIDELERLGYRRTASPGRAGEYAWSQGRLAVRVRRAPTPEGWRDGGLLEARFQGTRVAELRWGGEPAGELTLEPPQLTSVLGPGMGERRPVALDELPEPLLQAVLAAEDAHFYQHPGLSLSGILRAAWVNVRGGEVSQGGSTLTQQLVKNVFLTHERTLARKLREGALALLVDLRYTKRQILDAYLNEIYWGSSGGANLIGVGAAAWAYFGKHPGELDLCESALLAGMIRSPGSYSPAAHPQRARERRNWVLGRMAELGWIDDERLAAESSAALCFDPHPVVLRRAPYFTDAVLAEARHRFGIEHPEESGHVLLTSLDWSGQEQAEEAVAWGLDALESGWEKGTRHRQPLQSALVSLDPRSGEVLAWVGGRDYRASQFDRASSALRQAGSAFKPVVYSAAFEHGTAWPSGFVEDAPLTVAQAGNRWTPQNSDGEYRGWVTVRSAVERSLNVPTVRVALATDLRRIVGVARAMGIRTRLQPVPALALGAFEVTPVELATVYATLAAGGVRPGVHALLGALDGAGRPLRGAPPPPPERVLSATTAYLMTSVLQGVLERGTGSSARVQGLTDPLAGKTGTTNERRDSWFAGYSPDRTTLVWVGYDDNSETRLSGSRAALPIWARFTWAVRPLGGYPVFEQPAGVRTALIDPDSGELATEACPTVLTEVFTEERLPQGICRLHGFWRDWEPRRADQRAEGERKRWRWLRRVFSPRRDSGRPPG